MIVKINRNKLRFGLSVGWQLARWELIFGVSEFENVSKEIKEEILNLLHIDNITFQFKEPKELLREILNYYSIRDIEKHASILLGVSAMRLSVTKQLTNGSSITHLQDIAFSALMDIDNTILSDKKIFFQAMLDLRPQNIPEFINLIDNLALQKELLPKGKKIILIIRGLIRGIPYVGDAIDALIFGEQ